MVTIGGVEMRLRPIIGWAVFLFLATILVKVAPSPRGTYYFFKGKQLANALQFEAAADAFQQSVNSDPEFTRGYIELGSTLRTLKKYDQAETAFKKAASIEENSCASCGLGIVYHQTGKNKEAEVALKHAIQLDPKDSCAYDELGRLYYDQEDYAKAIEAFNERVKIQPNAVTYHFLGNSTYFSGKFEESLVFYEKAASLNPTYPDFYSDYGRAFNRLNRHKEALEVYERGLRIEPDDVMLHVGRGFTEFGIGNDNEAMAEYKKLQKLDPEWAQKLLKAIKTASVETKSEAKTR
jgi:tetratricopeptide (TPR) repeat protein